MTTSAVVMSSRTISRPRGSPEVDGHGPLVAALAEPHQRVAAVGLGAEAAEVVAGARALDLDHVGAELTEHGGAERPGDVGAEVEDPDAVEGLHAFSLLPVARCGRRRPALLPTLSGTRGLQEATSRGSIIRFSRGRQQGGLRVRRGPAGSPGSGGRRAGQGVPAVVPAGRGRRRPGPRRPVAHPVPGSTGPGSPSRPRTAASAPPRWSWPSSSSSSATSATPRPSWPPPRSSCPSSPRCGDAEQRRRFLGAVAREAARGHAGAGRAERGLGSAGARRRGDAGPVTGGSCAAPPRS